MSRNELITNYEGLVVDARNNQLLFFHAHRNRVNVQFNRRHSSKIQQTNENIDIKKLKCPEGSLLSARAINSERGHAVGDGMQMVISNYCADTLLNDK